MTDPIHEEWRRLFSAVGAFVTLRPWERVNDTEIFGVVDPASGEIGWCSVIGALGESLGLVINMGDAGLAAFDLLHAGGDAMRVGPTLRGLVFTLDDRKYLNRRDLAPIRALGLGFRGRQAWPCFRSLRPGYAPWHIDGAEARFLAIALEQGSAACARVGRDLDLRRDAGTLLVRRPVEGGVGWQDTRVRRPARPAPPPEPPEPAIDEDRLKRVALSCPKSSDLWECGQFQLPAKVGDSGERPFFPQAFLIVHSGSGAILHAGIDRPPFALKFVQAEFLATIERLGAVPVTVAVADARVRRALGPAATRLGVRITMPDALPAFDIARAGLEQHMA